jgi:hypothetical protein
MSAPRFVLRARADLRRATTERDLSRPGDVIAWGGLHRPALVVMTAERYEQLSGERFPVEAFTAAHFCPTCSAYTASGDCLRCKPPTVRASARKRSRSSGHTRTAARRGSRAAR